MNVCIQYLVTVNNGVFMTMFVPILDDIAHWGAYIHGSLQISYAVISPDKHNCTVRAVTLRGVLYTTEFDRFIYTHVMVFRKPRSVPTVPFSFIFSHNSIIYNKTYMCTDTNNIVHTT